MNWRHENLMRLFFRALRSFMKPGGLVKVASSKTAVGAPRLANNIDLLRGLLCGHRGLKPTWISFRVLLEVGSSYVENGEEDRLVYQGQILVYHGVCRRK